MRKVIILTYLLLGSISLLCLIGAEKSNLQQQNYLQKSKELTVLDHSDASLNNESESTDSLVFKSFNNAVLKNNPDVIEYTKLCNKTAYIEHICEECRKILEKAGIEDSMYDQYDNPEGRLHPYKVKSTIRRLFDLTKELNENKLRQQDLKRQYHLK